MKHTIFDSWQSDLDPSLTRNFIEDALNKAIKCVTKVGDIDVQAVIDRDTAGMAGTPGIAETIFNKIEKCDIFTCDISIINGNRTKRLIRIIYEHISNSFHKYRKTNAAPVP